MPRGQSVTNDEDKRTALDLDPIRKQLDEDFVLTRANADALLAEVTRLRTLLANEHADAAIKRWRAIVMKKPLREITWPEGFMTDVQQEPAE